ncbi:MAG: hypothetical protein EXR79_10425 [Myxococcales bacterium]|nr:hypothetical protein [Myxococcales bacterium]
MDQEFFRELLVLVFFLALYIGVAAALLRAHKTDLTAVSAKSAGGAGAGPVAVRLNKRRKAIAREQGAPESEAPK